MTKWFRFYADALRNPKVATLSDREFRLWVQLLSAASENEGRLPPAAELKHVLNTRLDHLLSGLKRLITVGLIDSLEQGYEPHNWEKFQYKSDTSTARVKEHRARRNVSETPPEADTEQRQKKEPIAQQSNAARDLDELERRLFEAAGIAGFRDERHPRLMDLSPIRGLLAKGYSLDADILPVIRDKARNRSFSSWAFFTAAIVENAAAKAAIPQKQTSVEDWPARLDVWRKDGTWAPAWGPKPGESGCRVPAEQKQAQAA